MSSEIGHRIRELRRARRLTQQALANRLDVASATVSRWESGKLNIAANTIPSIAHALGCQPGSLFAPVEQEPGTPCQSQSLRAGVPLGLDLLPPEPEPERRPERPPAREPEPERLPGEWTTEEAEAAVIADVLEALAALDPQARERAIRILSMLGRYRRRRIQEEHQSDVNGTNGGEPDSPSGDTSIPSDSAK